VNGRELRIGDKERDAAVTALGEHYVAGRLTKEEYDERSAVAWQAKTNADLAPLFVDLPLLKPPQPVTNAMAQRGAGAPVSPRRPRPRVPVFPLVLLLVVLLTVANVPWPVLLVIAILWFKLVSWRLWAGTSRFNRRSSGPGRSSGWSSGPGRPSGWGS
jgi:hypothetical protein